MIQEKDNVIKDISGKYTAQIKAIKAENSETLSVIFFGGVILLILFD